MRKQNPHLREFEERLLTQGTKQELIKQPTLTQFRARAASPESVIWRHWLASSTLSSLQPTIFRDLGCVTDSFQPEFGELGVVALRREVEAEEWRGWKPPLLTRNPPSVSLTGRWRSVRLGRMLPTCATVESDGESGCTINSGELKPSISAAVVGGRVPARARNPTSEIWHSDIDRARRNGHPIAKWIIASSVTFCEILTNTC